MKPAIYLSRQAGVDLIAFFAYDGTPKDLRPVKHVKQGHLREEKQNTDSTMIREEDRE